ncbi:hypothetical protein ACIBJF_49515 [Streptomyces sp. NPDC050743]|uniref:hypothetical protein n=1 Tax=Streptomyces sp. NPDC050743 TaxID=3365634 RepID=UPI00379F682E
MQAADGVGYVYAIGLHGQNSYAKIGSTTSPGTNGTHYYAGVPHGLELIDF